MKIDLHFKKNMMKKLLYLFIASTFLISCSSNDGYYSLDPIIGEWQQFSYTFNGEESELQIDECGKKSTYVFFKNGTGDSILFDFTSNDCTPFVGTLTWENIGDSTYNIDNGNHSEPYKLDFSNNNSFFKTTSTDISIDGTTDTEVFIYKRI